MKILTPINAVLRSIAALFLLLGWVQFGFAQPGDVNRIDIRLVSFDANTVEVQLRPNADWQRADGIVNLNFTVRWETAAGGQLGEPDQSFTGFSCVSNPLFLSENPGVGDALNNADNGGFRYKAYGTTGNIIPVACTIPANTWARYAQLPLTGLTGCTSFEVVTSDAYTISQDGEWFISMGGPDITTASQVVLPGAAMGTGATPSPGSYGPFCSTDADVSLGGTPSGGVWTGTGVSGSGPYVFDPSAGTQSLTYTVGTGNCAAAALTTITINQAPTTANAGPDQNICASSTTLAGNIATVGSGSWSVVGGSGTFANASSPTTTVSSLGAGANTFRWTISNAGCAASANDVVISNGPCDCNGDFGGTAFIDNCATCVGGNTGEVACVADCNGDFGGTAFIDNCATCVGGNTGEVACVADCNGDFGGTAFLDDCDICVGGNTGLAPCTVGCDNNVVIEFATDNNAADVSWSITAVGAGTPSCSGSNLPNNQPAYVTDVCCLSDGCYRLVVTDAGGDGIAGGGYVLRMAGNNGMRIIDNSNNFTVGSSSINTSLEDGAFCLPLGGVELLSSSCDKYFWANGQYIVCNEDAEVAADFNGGGVAGADSGYDFWFYNPNGGYSFIRERRHNVSDNFANIGSPRTCHMKVNNWATANHIPDQMNLNVRVRGVVNGVASSWGPACRFARNEALAICTPTKLFDIPGYVFYSCGVTRQFVTSSSQRLYARPVSGATQYQFRFSIPGEGVLVTRTANNYYATLGWTNDVPLVDGNTYDVEVRAFKGGIWCIWGETCQVTICNAPPCGMEANGGQQNVALDLNTTLSVWPNPNQGDQVHVNIIGLQDGVNKVTVDLFDLTGKRVISRQFAAQDGNMNTVMDLNGSMNSGMYMLRITAGEKVFTERLVIQH